jgi:hypothetical protein
MRHSLAQSTRLLAGSATDFKGLVEHGEVAWRGQEGAKLG